MLFADEAELKDRMRDGVLEGLRGAARAAMAAWPPPARGAPAATVNDLSRVVYSSCNLCPRIRPPRRSGSCRAHRDARTGDQRSRATATRGASSPACRSSTRPTLSTRPVDAPRPRASSSRPSASPASSAASSRRPTTGRSTRPGPRCSSAIVSTRAVPNLGLEYRKLLQLRRDHGERLVGCLQRQRPGEQVPERLRRAHLLARPLRHRRELARRLRPQPRQQRALPAHLPLRVPPRADQPGLHRGLLGHGGLCARRQPRLPGPAQHDRQQQPDPLRPAEHLLRAGARARRCWAAS